MRDRIKIDDAAPHGEFAAVLHLRRAVVATAVEETDQRLPSEAVAGRDPARERRHGRRRGQALHPRLDRRDDDRTRAGREALERRHALGHELGRRRDAGKRLPVPRRQRVHPSRGERSVLALAEKRAEVADELLRARRGGDRDDRRAPVLRRRARDEQCRRGSADAEHPSRAAGARQCFEGLGERRGGIGGRPQTQRHEPTVMRPTFRWIARR